MKKPLTTILLAISFIALPAMAEDGGTREANLTDQEFFAQVNLALPALSELKNAVARSDWKKARAEWAAIFAPGTTLSISKRAL